MHFVELTCAPATMLRRLGEPGRRSFGKLTDAELYRKLELQGAFAFPKLPAPVLTIDTDEDSADVAAERIRDALRLDVGA